MSLRVGSVTPRFVLSQNISPTAVAANSTSLETFTVTGLATDMILLVNMPSLDAGVVLLSAIVSAKDTMKLSFINLTNGSITPTASQEARIVAL